MNPWAKGAGLDDAARLDAQRHRHFMGFAVEAGAAAIDHIGHHIAAVVVVTRPLAHADARHAQVLQSLGALRLQGIGLLVHAV